MPVEHFNYFLLYFWSFILIIRGYAFISSDAESPLTLTSDLNAAVIRLNSDALTSLSFARLENSLLLLWLLWVNSFFNSVNMLLNFFLILVSDADLAIGRSALLPVALC